MAHRNDDRRGVLGASGHRLVIDGIELAYDDEGDGPPVVCLHAIGHGATDFAGLRRRLAGARRVIALDWPGQGNSASDRVPASAARYALLLAQFLDALGIGRAVIVGNSIGGAAAIAHAAAHPESVHALVLENPGGLAATGDRAAQAILGLMARFFGAGARRAQWFPAAFAAYYHLCVLSGAASREQRRRIVASAFEVAPVLAEAWRSFAEPAAYLGDLAPAVRCPVLFAWAERDAFVSLGRSRPAIDRFPDARLRRFSARHAAHLETPDELETAVEGFLDEIGWGDRDRLPLPALTGSGGAATRSAPLTT